MGLFDGFRPYVTDPPHAIERPDAEPFVNAEAVAEVGNDDAPIDAGIGVKLRLGGVDDDSPKRIDPDKVSKVLTIPSSYNAQNPALTYGFLEFPSPTRDKVWELLRVSASGPDPFTVLAGVSMIAFVSQQSYQDSATEPPGFPDLLAGAGSVPNTLYIGRRTCIIRSVDNVILCFKGLANAQEIQGSIAVIEHDYATFIRSLRS